MTPFARLVENTHPRHAGASAPFALVALATALTACGSSFGPAGAANPPAVEAPFTVKSGLFDASHPEDLGLPSATGTESVTIFRPTAASDHFANGVVLAAFKGHLYAQWQSSATDEDSADTSTVYSRSPDGKVWSAPTTLAASSSEGPRTSGGFWVAGGTLVAYLNLWPTSLSPRGGFTQYVTSTDGLAWSAPRALTMADGAGMSGVFEQDPHALPDGRIISAAHFQPGLTVAPCYTDDASGTTGWTRAPFANLARTKPASSREMEPSWYRRSDGAVVMVFRDQDSSFRKLAAISSDRGATWSAPVLTDMPDSRSKQSAGNLPDGTAYFVGNPVTSKLRTPLVVTLSRDGRLFDRAFVLRTGRDLQALRYPGRAKTLGYSYPKSMVAGGYLYVGYSTNKEDVELTRVPLASLAY